MKYFIIQVKHKKALVDNKYNFNVPLLDNKLIIKKYIENFFNVEVIKINIKRTLKKKKKSKKYLKKAIITLKKGNKIELL